MAFAITEPDAGSNSHKLATTATGEGGTWVVRGQKYCISGADEADSVLVVTRRASTRRAAGACRCS
jgi:alkylation response protein AidB-like acyl-CoA dehydrogenase